uniref:Uncharacterized protein n=1 Tax=Ixodes ricinus TaxID=34613 RepID=A0A6B0V3T5_IXORI
MKQKTETNSTTTCRLLRTSFLFFYFFFPFVRAESHAQSSTPRPREFRYTVCTKAHPHRFSISQGALLHSFLEDYALLKSKGKIKKKALGDRGGIRKKRRRRNWLAIFEPTAVMRLSTIPWEYLLALLPTRQKKEKKADGTRFRRRRAMHRSTPSDVRSDSNLQKRHSPCHIKTILENTVRNLGSTLNKLDFEPLLATKAAL